MNDNVDKSSFGYEATWAKTDNYVSKILVFGLTAYIIERFNQKSVKLESPKKAPLGKTGTSITIK